MATRDSPAQSNSSKLEDQLKLWRAKLDVVMAKANVAGQEAKIESRDQLDELKAKVEGAQSKLDEAKAAGSERWGDFKNGVEKTWNELEGAFKKLLH